MSILDSPEIEPSIEPAVEASETVVCTETLFNDLTAKLAALEAENKALKASKGIDGDVFPVTVPMPDGNVKTYSLMFRVSDKGAVSVYGFGRFPVTHYPPQWLALLQVASDLNSFITENSAKLSWTK